jgi:competence protein ComFC
MQCLIPSDLEVGELLYQLKYRRNRKAIVDLAEVATGFVKRWKPQLDAIVPVPATRIRVQQPVVQIAIAVGKRLDLPVLTDLIRTRRKPKELKNVYSYDERIKLLEGAYMIEGQDVRDKAILLVDDLYRSGATLNAITRVLYEQGRCSDVYALAVTRTRIAS